jgi:hypothetical protein
LIILPFGKEDLEIDRALNAKFSFRFSRIFRNMKEEKMIPISAGRMIIGRRIRFIALVFSLVTPHVPLNQRR